MPIEFRCTNCHRRLRTPDGTAGKRTKCPECGTALTIPAGETEAPPPSPPETQPGPEAAAAANPYAVAANPYAAPTVPPPAAPGEPWADLRAYAAAKVKGPAIGLIVAAGLGLAAELLTIAMAGIQIAASVGVGNAAFDGPQLMLALQGAFAIIDVLILVGALKMMRLESYGLAMTASILAMIPHTCGGCCLAFGLPQWFLGLAFGIWSVVVLSDAHVRNAFQRHGEASGSTGPSPPEHTERQ